MGFVILHITLRVERPFKIRIPKNLPDELGLAWDDDEVDATLAQFYDYILRLCREQNVPLPPDSWSVLVDVVQDASSLKLKEVTAATRLVRDIAPGG